MNSKYQSTYNDLLRRYNLAVRMAQQWTPNLAWHTNSEGYIQMLEGLLAKYEIKMMASK